MNCKLRCAKAPTLSASVSGYMKSLVVRVGVPAYCRVLDQGRDSDNFSRRSAGQYRSRHLRVGVAASKPNGFWPQVGQIVCSGHPADGDAHHVAKKCSAEKEQHLTKESLTSKTSHIAFASRCTLSIYLEH